MLVDNFSNLLRKKALDKSFSYQKIFNGRDQHRCQQNKFLKKTTAYENCLKLERCTRDDQKAKYDWLEASEFRISVNTPSLGDALIRLLPVFS
mgnify:CR=1 FL=1